MAARSAAERREELVALYQHLRTATTARLKATRTKLVFGAGNADAEVMFVGEAPGAQEDLQGLPFVGRAGQLLNELLREIGLDRQEVFVANVLKCLRYNAPIQLADGSWERIGRLVRSRYSGEVMSVAADGSLVPKRVTGWHATPLAGRSVYRLTYKSAKPTGRHRVGTELTGDHPVLTERGYVKVADLLNGDRVAVGQGLSDVAFDVVCGTLLGDGSLNRGSSYLQMAHSDRQAAYAGFKHDLLAELNPTYHELAIASGGVEEYPIVHVRTKAARALRVLRHDFYGSKKRVPPWLAGRMNPRMLAFWFMDDGYTRIRPPRQPSAEIASVAFDDEDMQVLLAGLRRLGLPAKALRGRIYFDVETTRKLSELIAPFVPPSMRYKLHPEVVEAVPFDRSRFRPGPPKVMYDSVEVEDITTKPRNDTTFFCIDVEDTHNFVTAGGVVHNCRPPGNRDPLPDEIAECEPHLMEQIRLIQPKVICTLGNFATKLLTGQPTGITRACGRPQHREIAGLEVVLYPLFHPAAALRTPATKQKLREDMARLPQLIEEQRPKQEAALAQADAAQPAAEEPEPAPQLGLFGS